MKNVVPCLPITRDKELETEIELRLLAGLRARTERGLFLSPVVLDAENGRDYLGFSAIGIPPCALWYSLKGVEPMEEDQGSRSGFDTGHILESYVLDLLGVLRRQVEVAVSWTRAPGGKILGHADGLMELSGIARSLVLECKATGGYSFCKKQEEGPDPAHVAQAFCYAACLDAHGFTVIYVNREAKKASALFQVFAFVLDEGDGEDALKGLIRERFGPVLEALTKGERPPAPKEPKWEFGPRGWRCRPDR